MKLKLYYALKDIQFNSRWSFIYLYKSVNFFVLLFFNCENHWLVCLKSYVYKKWINHCYIRETTLGKNVYWMFIFFFTCRVRAVVTKNIYWSFLQLLFKVRQFSLNLIDLTFGHIFMLIFDSKENLLYTSINVKWTWSLFYDLLVHFLNKLP